MDIHGVVQMLVTQILHIRRQVSKEDWTERIRQDSYVVLNIRRTDVAFSNFLGNLNIRTICTQDVSLPSSGKEQKSH